MTESESPNLGQPVSSSSVESKGTTVSIRPMLCIAIFSAIWGAAVSLIFMRIISRAEEPANIAPMIAEISDIVSAVMCAATVVVAYLTFKR